MIHPQLQKHLEELGATIERNPLRDGRHLDVVQIPSSDLKYYFNQNGNMSYAFLEDKSPRMAEFGLTDLHHNLINHNHDHNIDTILRNMVSSLHHFLTQDKNHRIVVMQSPIKNSDGRYTLQHTIKVSNLYAPEPNDKFVENKVNDNSKLDDDGQHLSKNATLLAKAVLKTRDSEYALEDALREDHPSLFTETPSNYSRHYSKIINK